MGAVVLFAVSARSGNSAFSVVQTLPNAAAIAGLQKTTLVNAAELFSQMRVSSPVFNSWLSVSPANVLLYPDDPSSDFVYHLAHQAAGRGARLRRQLLLLAVGAAAVAAIVVDVGHGAAVELLAGGAAVPGGDQHG